MIKDCGHALKVISEYCHNELPEAETRLVEAHLKTCAACAAEYGHLRYLLGTVAETARSGVLDDPVLRTRLKAAVDEARTDRLPVLRRTWLSSLAGAAAAVILLLFLGLHGQARIDASLVNAELVQSFAQDYKDTLLAFAYAPSGTTEYRLFEEFYEYVETRTGSEEKKLVRANYQFLVRNIDSFI